jgi:ABC-type polysaccharide/polyol phosphate transport system ATPase subunit
VVGSYGIRVVIMALEPHVDVHRVRGLVFAPPAIVAEGLGKRYLIYDRPGDRIKELWPWRKRAYHREFWALRNVSFRVAAGDSLGVIGENGAGKSTLLRILSGTLTGTDGTVSVRGTVGALLDLGAGFHPDYTGRENIYLSGSIMGFTRAAMTERMEGIIEFSGLQEFIDQPVKTYSTGMYLRLGFSVATAIDPDVLIIDEVLAVGDERFQRKCIARIEVFLERRKTMVMCSHSTYVIKKLCKRAVWLDHGSIKAIGRASEACDEYQDFVRQKEGEDRVAPADAATAPAHQAAGLAVELVEARVCDEQGRARDLFELGETIRVYLVADAHDYEETPAFAVGLVRNDGVALYGVSTEIDGVQPNRLSGQRYGMIFELPRIQLLPGRYEVRMHACDRSVLRILDTKVHEIVVRGEVKEIGIYRVEHRWLEP